MFLFSHQDNYITSFDFNPSGETVATFDRQGVCVVSDVSTGNCNYQVDMGGFGKLNFQMLSFFIF